MKTLTETVSNNLLVLAGGAGAWLGIMAFAAQAGLSIAPVGLVMVMAGYIIAFSVLVFFVHGRSVAGLPFEDDDAHRRPSLVIPSVSTIALMIFVVGYATSHPTIWTMA